MGREEETVLVEANMGLVKKIACRRFSSRCGDDDLLQAGLIGLWEAAKAWDGAGPFQALASAAIYHNMLDYVRAKDARSNETDELDANTPDNGDGWQDLDREELLDKISRAWPEGSKERYILLHLAQGADKRAIAEQMGVDTYTVTKTARRAVKRLQEDE